MKRTAHPRTAEGLEDACWEGYEAVGMKEKDGRQVPNCVPTKTAAGFPRGFDMTENPLQTLKRVPGFQAVSDKALSTKNRAFGIVPTNTLSAHQLSQIWSIDPRDTVTLVDKHGMALWVGSPADLKLNLKATDSFPWPEVRESAGLVAKTAAHRLDGVRGHQLLPSALARKLPPIYSQENVEDPIVQVKLFSPYSGAVWYLTEYDPASREAFGWADLGMGGGELGYISVAELEGLNRGGLPLVERDLYWRPVPLSKAKGGRMASSKYPSAVREVEGDYMRKAITRGERDELLAAISRASSKQEAERIVSEHRKGRTAAVRVAARYLWRNVPVDRPTRVAGMNRRASNAALIPVVSEILEGIGRGPVTRNQLSALADALAEDVAEGIVNGVDTDRLIGEALANPDDPEEIWVEWTEGEGEWAIDRHIKEDVTTSWSGTETVEWDLKYKGGFWSELNRLDLGGFTDSEGAAIDRILARNVRVLAPFIVAAIKQSIPDDIDMRYLRKVLKDEMENEFSVEVEDDFIVEVTHDVVDVRPSAKGISAKMNFRIEAKGVELRMGRGSRGSYDGPPDDRYSDPYDSPYFGNGP